MHSRYAEMGNGVKIFMKKYGIGIAVGVLVSLAFLVMDAEQIISTVKQGKAKERYTIVLDSGHGGVDPGKISVDGVYEKNINLSIAKKLEKILARNDCRVIMTRESDKGLYQESDSNKKRADMAKRLEIMNGCKADLVISIHQNSYTDASSRGAQVFYHTASENGKNLATYIQNAMIEKVAPNNHRQPKANNDYYLLRNSTSTMVIVECGFLSNLQESKQLQDTAYQKEVAEAIAMGTLQYLGEVGKTEDRKEELDGNKNIEGRSGTVSQ